MTYILFQNPCDSMHNTTTKMKLLVMLTALIVTAQKCSAQDLGRDIAEKLTTFANDGLGIQAFQVCLHFWCNQPTRQ